MSLARAFTTRRVKQSLELKDAADKMHRSNSTAKAPQSIRQKISGPVQLISTTNMLSYNAPDLYPKTSRSSKSDDDSDAAHSTASASTTPPTSPDSPHPTQAAPKRDSPEPNHLSCYFTPPGQTAGDRAATPPTTVVDAPVIPQRAPSHIKKSYETLTRKRSTSRMSEQSTRTVSSKASFSFSRSSSASTSTSATSHASYASAKLPSTPALPSTMGTPSAPPPVPLPALPSVPSSHKKEASVSHHNPFGNELAQVSELAEEYSPRQSAARAIVDEEESELQRKGLNKFSAEDYLGEIQGLVASIFGDAKPVRPLWI